MTDTTIHTEDGAHVGGKAETGGGDFAGRDKIGQAGNVLSGQFPGAIINIGSTITGSVQQIGVSPTPEFVEAARQRLAGLPLDRLPEPAALPPGSRMLHPRNRQFVGREEDLRWLAKVLKTEEIVTVTGLGGIGKTQLATEFVHRYGQFFAGGVFWLNFADAAGIPAEIAACGRREHLDLVTDYDRLKIDDQVRLVLRAWQSGLPRLLIFDNCEEEDLLARWRPAAGGCRVLVTSRRGVWRRALGVQALPLATLPRVQSIELLRKYRPDLGAGHPALAKIAGELGDLPLALSLAGGYLETYADDPRFGDPARFLAELGETRLLHHPALQGQEVGHSPTGHELNVGKTFALSYERLQGDDPADVMAVKLLNRAAFFAPGEPISRELLLATLEMEEGDEEGARQAARGLARLLGLGLVDGEQGGTVRLHRLVRVFVRGSGAGGQRSGEVSEAQAAVEALVLAKIKCFNKDGYPLSRLHWQPQFRAVLDRAIKRQDEREADLCDELGSHLRMIGNYKEAQPYFERALALRQKLLGSENPETAMSLNNLAVLCQDLGNYSAAGDYFKQALAICRKLPTVNALYTATVLNNWAGLLKIQGDYDTAQLYYNEALDIRHKELGFDHPDTATTLNNLASLLQRQCNYSEAQKYYKQAYHIRQKVCGSQHPDTAQTLANLADLLQDKGEYITAHEYYEQALEIYKKRLGPEHPTTANCLSNFASLLTDQGEYLTAQDFHQTALKIQKKMLGSEHPDTAACLNNLGDLYLAQGDYGAARDYYKQALEIRVKLLPKDPVTASNLVALAHLLYAPHSYKMGQCYYQEALSILEVKRGPSDPEIEAIRTNIGGIFNFSARFVIWILVDYLKLSRIWPLIPYAKTTCTSYV